MVIHKGSQILDFLKENPNSSSKAILDGIPSTQSLATVKRLLTQLLKENWVIQTGAGKGSKYSCSPLDNEFQIKEALYQMCALINDKVSIFEKALLALLLLSYIQPFVDGNKRTARIISNAILIENGYCPISFRTVDSIDYKKAMLVFYEQNNFQPMKAIFIEQFEFAVKTYF
jgi:fido (protein-threonine AMPylation protein)